MLDWTKLQSAITHSTRGLTKHRKFAASVIVSLSLGTFVSTLMFSIFNSVVINALPYPDSNRLMAVYGISSRVAHSHLPLSRSRFDQLRDKSQVFDAIGYYMLDQNRVLTESGSNSSISSVRVSPDFFDVFNTPPMLGRTFRAEEFAPGRDDVVILGHSLWEQEFSSDRSLIGHSILLDGSPYLVVGVMPPAFRFPSAQVQLWFPDTSQPAFKEAGDKMTVSRLHPGVTIDQARALLTVISRQAVLDRLTSVFPDFTLSVSSLQEQMVGPTKRILDFLALAAAMLQIVVWANVTNLLMVRNVTRRKEVAVKMALGASRVQLILGFVIDSILLGIASGGAALGMTILGIRVVRKQFAASLVNFSPVTMDGQVLAASLILSVVSGTLCGLIPALRASKVDPAKHLQEGSGSSSSGFGFLRGNRLQTVFAVSQVAFALVLLVAFGFLYRSMSELMAVDLGFNPHRLIAFQLGQDKVPPGETEMLQQIITRVNALPGVQSTALSSTRPLLGLRMMTLVGVRNPEGGWSMSPVLQMQSVSSEYFKLMAISVLEGRVFSAQDSHDSPCVVVVNNTLARALWPGHSAVEQAIDLNGASGGSPYICTVVGVVADIRDIDRAEATGLELYFDFLQRDQGTHGLLVKPTEKSAISATAIIKTIGSIDPSQQIRSVDDLDEVVNASIYQPRLRTIVLGLFAVLASTVAMMGLYASMSYSVVQRTHEMVIRGALGATRVDLMRLVLIHSGRVVCVGMTVGLVAAFVVAQVFQGLVYHARPKDPLIYISTVALVLSVSFIATVVPAYRASRVSSSDILRGST